MTLAVDCRGLSKNFGDRPALRDLDLRVEAGTVVGLLGPNGAGKTTLIRILTTILTADAGSFTVAGVPGDQPGRLRRRVGVLPESAGYPANQTGEQVLRFHARLFGQSAAEARTTAGELLEQVGLAERGGSLVGGYSRGMRQRLGIARALVNRPDVVFLDEPTLGLDPGGQRQVLQLISAVTRERGATVVLSTHLLADVETVCDRVVVLNRGAAVAHGTVAEVADRATAPREGRLRVPPDRLPDVVEALSRTPRVSAAGPAEVPGELRFVLHEGVSADEGSAAVLAAAALAGAPVLSFEIERGRLSDAFLAVTAEAGPPEPAAVAGRAAGARTGGRDG